MLAAGSGSPASSRGGGTRHLSGHDDRNRPGLCDSLWGIQWKGVVGGRREAWRQELWPSMASEGVLSVVADSVRRAAWLPTAAQRRAYLAAVPQVRRHNTVPARSDSDCKPKGCLQSWMNLWTRRFTSVCRF